jgi:hypothetical protein
MSEPAPVTAPEQPAVRRAHEIAHLIQSGDRAVARTYAEQHYAPAFLRIPMDVHLGFISHMHDQTRGVVVAGVHRAAPAAATILIRGVLTGIVQGLEVEAGSHRASAEPHRRPRELLHRAIRCGLARTLSQRERLPGAGT